MFDPRPPCYGNTGDWYSTNTMTLYFAAQLCRTCPHQEACRALGENEDHGIWGGELKDPKGSTIAVTYRKTCLKMKAAEIDLLKLKARLDRENRDILDE